MDYVTGLYHSGIGRPTPPRSAGNQALAELRGRITELEAELAAERSRSASHRADFERERERGDRLATEITALRASLTAWRRWWPWRRAG